MDNSSPCIIGIRSKVFQPAFREVKSLTEQQERLVVAIDGRCGSGKTRLAQLLARKFDGRVVHIDDYYLPMEERRSDWRQHPGANIDFKRLVREALLPAFYTIFSGDEGGVIEYRPYSCKEGKYLETKKLPVQCITIIEGSYAFHPQLIEEFQKEAFSSPVLRKFYRPGSVAWKFPYDSQIFLTCSEEIQCKRLKRREGENFENFKNLWIPLEEQYIKECEAVRDRWTIKIDTGVR